MPHRHLRPWLAGVTLLAGLAVLPAHASSQLPSPGSAPSSAARPAAVEVTLAAAPRPARTAAWADVLPPVEVASALAATRTPLRLYAPDGQIDAEARARFGLERACCAHRVGQLQIGELAVWVGVSAAHRGEAFDACRYIIDQVKHRLPIWKKEYYADGDSGWVNCERCAAAPSVGEVLAHEHV